MQYKAFYLAVMIFGKVQAAFDPHHIVTAQMHKIPKLSDLDVVGELTELNEVWNHYSDTNIGCSRLVSKFALFNLDSCPGKQTDSRIPPEGVAVSILAKDEPEKVLAMTGNRVFADGLTSYACHVTRGYYGCSREFLQYGVRHRFINACPYDHTLDVKTLPWIDYSPIPFDLRSTVYCLLPGVLEAAKTAGMTPIEAAIAKLTQEENLIARGHSIVGGTGHYAGSGVRSDRAVGSGR